jgi:peptidoglycan/LPS O-acetylase OafA/YrhL
MLASGVPSLLHAATTAAIGADAMAALRFSDEFLWSAVVGALFSMHLIGAAGLLRTGEPARSGAAIRWLAGASFSIYLVHYPALQIVDAALPELAAPALRDLLLLAAVLSICLAFAQAFERTLPDLRRALVLVAGRDGVPRHLASARAPAHVLARGEAPSIRRPAAIDEQRRAGDQRPGI